MARDFTKNTHKRLDQIFSRKTLGSMLFGLAFTKFIVYLLALFINGTLAHLIAWGSLVLVFLGLFLWWERFERTLSDDEVQSESSSSSSSSS